MNRRSVTALALAAVASITVVTGCSSTATEPAAPAAVSAAASAPALGAQLDPAGFASALKRPGTVVLDVRTPEEFAEGHLPGAINVDVSAADFATRIAALDKDTPYAVYCRSGNRSGVALEAMKAQGFTNAYHLGGGIGAWQSAGGEIVTS